MILCIESYQLKLTTCINGIKQLIQKHSSIILNMVKVTDLAKYNIKVLKQLISISFYSKMYSLDQL